MSYGKDLTIRGMSASVFVYVTNAEGEVLLVLNKAKMEPFVKPSKWGLPGGGVEKRDVRDPERWAQVLSTALLGKYLMLFKEGRGEKEEDILCHAAWREVYEETGYFIDPESIVRLGEPEEINGHLIFLVHAEIVGGKLKTTPGEDTVTAGWFPLGNIANLMRMGEIYLSHSDRIGRAQALVARKKYG